MSDATNFGWALRKNGSCLASEVDCGETVAPYRVCCPGGSFCPHAENVACCPSKAYCTAALNGQPRCANSTWDLYINGNYYCCEQGTIAYAKDGGSNGCGNPGYKLQAGETSLSIISAAQTATSSTTAVSSPTSSSAPTSTTTQPNHSPSHTNTGAIAGGVVGGVASAAIIIGLAWFFIRRSRRLQRPPSEPAAQMVASGDYYPVPPAELDGNRVSELPGDNNAVAELPVSYR
ncbi:hypothetical protein RU639_003865 [Aspergillus parasiticus]